MKFIEIPAKQALLYYKWLDIQNCIYGIKNAKVVNTTPDAVKPKPYKWQLPWNAIGVTSVQ